MPNLCFKPRKGGHTVQLVRHVYCPVQQRSKTVTLGSLPLDADPDELKSFLKLRQGISLTDSECAQVREWLLRHGDPNAIRRRSEAMAGIESRVRAKVLAELAATTGDALERAVTALDEAAKAWPGLAEQAREAGKDLWATLRPGYIKVNDASGRFFEAAQKVGIVKRRKRSGNAENVPQSAGIGDTTATGSAR